MCATWVRMILGFFLCLLLVSVGSTPVSAQTCPTFSQGDVNGDNSVTPADALLAFRYFFILPHSIRASSHVPMW